MGEVYLNGAFVDDSEAAVSVFDHGLLTGDGVFESVVVRNGRPFALSRHLQRLAASARVLDLVCPPLEALSDAAVALVTRSGLERAKLRITVTGGPGSLGSARGSVEPTVVIACEPLRDVPAQARLVIAPWTKNERAPTAGAKTISYADNVVALAYATRHNATEAIFFNLAGNLCEGTSSNVFVGLDGELATPPLSAGCLAGVTRGFLLQLTGALQRDISRDELARADEVFISSTTRGVQPVASLDGTALPSCPGPLTRAAAEAFDEQAARGAP